MQQNSWKQAIHSILKNTVDNVNGSTEWSVCSLLEDYSNINQEPANCAGLHHRVWPVRITNRGDNCPPPHHTHTGMYALPLNDTSWFYSLQIQSSWFYCATHNIQCWNSLPMFTELHRGLALRHVICLIFFLKWARVSVWVCVCSRIRGLIT